MKNWPKEFTITLIKVSTIICLTEGGLVISSQWPFVGAFPDGVVNCTCCGREVLEIKCPYCHRESGLQTAAAQDSQFCLKASHGELRLDHNHAYYYQVQTKLFVCDVQYADFCVCTFMADERQGSSQDSKVHIEQIFNFGQNALQKHNTFFGHAYFLKSWVTGILGQVAFQQQSCEQCGSSGNTEDRASEDLSGNSSD